MTPLDQLSIKIFADGANLDQIKGLAANPLISGYTTNPSLAFKAGVTDFVAFAQAAAQIVAPKSISFEVIADDFEGMERQARILASFGANVFVKIPVTNTKGEFTGPVIKALAASGVAVNVTAIFTMSQVDACRKALGAANGYLSIFAGRIADTGRDPTAIIRAARSTCPQNIKILWASPREVWNIWEANEAGADIITVAPELLAKLPGVGRSLEDFSLETVRMFYDDALKAGYQIIAPNSYGAGGF